MIYLTGQLLFFLLMTAFLGFAIGWLLRGAMLPASMYEDKAYIYHTEKPSDQPSYFAQASSYVSGTPVKQPEHVET